MRCAQPRRSGSARRPWLGTLLAQAPLSSRDGQTARLCRRGPCSNRHPRSAQTRQADCSRPGLPAAAAQSAGHSRNTAERCYESKTSRPASRLSGSRASAHGPLSPDTRALPASLPIPTRPRGRPRQRQGESRPSRRVQAGASRPERTWREAAGEFAASVPNSTHPPERPAWIRRAIMVL